ncbi:pirin family protein [Janthinobacterium agaricidamnosum]|uniref:Pirin C-terminal cupin domain protein n=1 Tax=Janthinobacterium agaricidamnosum NBRC 102515 = DSM 9628 TaxID=1349767 RepID=W0V4X1_9BURK|nr:pirin family protein [Janthinobacterium agaricidamnosum]CDG82645.1 pirin C-terminal cupin domain protein [Janthinobacterium agaricidamnosum NBRC 102515 = DSM 9628]
MAIIKGHEKDLGGGFKVRRFLPAAVKQAVGPFIFFDHFGPIDVAPGANHDVRPHPHIGLATVTYLFEGAIDHRDSIGSFQRIEPGAINWMTAGRGIVHSERTPPDLADAPHRSHGLQLWAALPLQHEEDAPSFTHTPQAALPLVEIDGGKGSVRVLIGSAFGRTSPVATYMETLYLDIKLAAGQSLALAGLPAEAALYPISGALEIDGVPLQLHTMALLDSGSTPLVQASGDAQFVVIGGAALDGHRYIFWNFVSSSKERIARAADDWSAQAMGQVPGETEFIALPRPPR